MSTIRNQLDRAKAEYNAAVYPGDLAAEVVSMRISFSEGTDRLNADRLAAERSAEARFQRSRWWWAGGGSAAAAAVLMLGFYVSQYGAGGNQAGVVGQQGVIPMTIGSYIGPDGRVIPVGNLQPGGIVFPNRQAGMTGLSSGVRSPFDSRWGDSRNTPALGPVPVAGRADQQPRFTEPPTLQMQPDMKTLDYMPK